MHSEPGFAEMRRLIVGHALTITISAVATLKIPDHLAEGPKDTATLARLTGTHEDFLRRVLRFLASEGVFAALDGDRFALTERSRWLRSDVAGSLYARAVFTGSSLSWTGWGKLLDGLKSGTSTTEAAFGQPLFDYLKTAPDAATFYDFMAQQTAASVAALLEAYDFAGVREIVDVGGGHGALLAGVLLANREARGILFDMPEVVAGAQPLLDRAGVADRCRMVGGDFFAAVPPGADLYLLKFILHDWSDSQCVGILRNCRQAMAEGGRVLIVEHMISEGAGPDIARFMDINMMVFTSGRERTRAEFVDLLDAAGLQLRKAVPTAIGLYALECAAQ
jgi:O-methyltransferase domain